MQTLHKDSYIMNTFECYVKHIEQHWAVVATAYELAAIEGLDAVLNPLQSTDKKLADLAFGARKGASMSFDLYRVLSIPRETERRLFHVLHVAGLAYCGDRWTDLQRWFTDHKAAVEIPSVADVSWDKRLLFRLFDAWMRLLRKQNTDDLKQIPKIVLELRNDQASYEAQFLNKAEGNQGKSLALRLIALYHLAKATERLAIFILHGEPTVIEIETELDQHFEAAIKASELFRDMELEMILRWLHFISRKMVTGSDPREKKIYPKIKNQSSAQS